MLLHSVIRAHLIGVKLDIRDVQSGSRGPTKLEFRDVPHSTSSGIIFKFADQVNVHAAQHSKASTMIFLKPTLVGLSIETMLHSVAILGCNHLLGQGFQNLLLIKNILDFRVPNFIIVTI